MEDIELEKLFNESQVEQDNPRHSYDFVIPGYIRTFPGLSWKEKSLYGIIRNLCRQEGYCWATAAYLAKEMECDDRTVRRWLAHLIEVGLVETEVFSLKMVNRRKIWLKEAIVFKKSLIRAPVSGSLGQQCPDDAVRNVIHTKERYITEEKNPPYNPPLESGDEVQLSKPPQRKKAKEEYVKRVARVFTTPSQHQSLLERARGDESLVLKWYNRLSEWKISKNLDGGSRDYIAILTWVIDAALNEPMRRVQSVDATRDNKDFAKKVKDKYQSNSGIRVEVDGIEFIAGPNYQIFTFSEGEFKDKVLNKLRNWNLPTEGL